MSEAAESHRVELLDFILANYPRAGAMSLTVDDPLLESGVIDSLGILRLVNFIEDSFGVMVSEDDLDPDNFTSVATIAEFVGRKRG